ncbi:MAG: DNA polymerase III subunit delta [bacterium]
MARVTARRGAGPAAVLSDIAAGRFRSVYVLAGPDRAAADDIVAALRAALVEPGFEGFDLETAYAGDAGVGTVLEHARQAPMMSKRRLVILREAERLKAPEFKTLLEGLADLPDGNTMVVTVDPDGPKKKALSSAGLGGSVVDLGQPGTGDLPALLDRWARERKLELEPAAAQLLLELAGTDTATLRSELDKFALGLDPGTKLTAKTVRRFAGHSRTFLIREYLVRLMTLDTGRALSELESLNRLGESPVTILGWLEGNFLELARLQAGRISQYAAWRTRDFAGRWRDPAMVRRCLLRLYDIHRAAVSGHHEAYTLLAQFTVCAACRPPDHCAIFDRPKRPEFCLRRMQARTVRSEQ